MIRNTLVMGENGVGNPVAGVGNPLILGENGVGNPVILVGPTRSEVPTPITAIDILIKSVSIINATLSDSQSLKSH